MYLADRYFIKVNNQKHIKPIVSPLIIEDPINIEYNINRILYLVLL